MFELQINAPSSLQTSLIDSKRSSCMLAPAEYQWTHGIVLFSLVESFHIKAEYEYWMLQYISETLWWK